MIKSGVFDQSDPHSPLSILQQSEEPTSLLRPYLTRLFLSVVSGGRSRLHLLDLGSCDAKALGGEGGAAGGGKGKEGSSPTSAPLCLSLSALGNVILALVNGSKHIPYK